MSAPHKPLGAAPKTTILHCRVSVAEMDAWVAEARRVASVEAWNDPERSLARWVRRALNAAVKGGAK